MAILLTVLACIAVRSEKKKTQQIKGSLKTMNKVLRAQVLDHRDRTDNQFFKLSEKYAQDLQEEKLAEDKIGESLMESEDKIDGNLTLVVPPN